MYTNTYMHNSTIVYMYIYIGHMPASPPSHYEKGWSVLPHYMLHAIMMGFPARHYLDQQWHSL